MSFGSSIKRLPHNISGQDSKMSVAIPFSSTVKNQIHVIQIFL